ncbi:hypothetical protein [uncultured Chryseobacterium sp.]|uniref:hypothetical protein n=1 Tax=uncultured Chryseobacterium sp. TaxID=259322 RepID=UPI0025DB7321|nr:hypothetical protein [uncultured Chryseobacterium sp.]
MLLIITFAISAVIEMYSKIFKKESKAFYVMVLSMILLLPVTSLSNCLVRNEIIKHLKTEKIIQGNPAFSKEELSDIHISDEKKMTIGPDINIVLLPRHDTLYLNRDFRDRNKFWIHYKKYEILKLTASIGYIIKK